MFPFKKLIILIVVGGIILFFFLTRGIDFKIAEEKEIKVTDEKIAKILDLVKESMSDIFIQEHGTDFVKKESIINLIHIKKSESGYEFDCFFGPAYESANLNKMFPDKLVSMGQIKECNLETIRVIDEAVRSEKVKCNTFTTLIPSQINDYYFFAIKIGEQEITYELISELNKNWTAAGMENTLECFSPMEDMIGETMAKHGTGIVDLNANLVYY